MSTPVFEERKEAEVDLQQRIQYMIDLQNEELTLSQQQMEDDNPYTSASSRASSRSRGEPPISTSTTNATSVPINFGGGDDDERIPIRNNIETTQDLSQDQESSSAMGTKQMSRSVGLSSLHDFHQALQQEEQVFGQHRQQNPMNDTDSDALLQPQPPKNSDRSSVTNSSTDALLEPGVGRGTLYVNPEKLGAAAAAAMGTNYYGSVNSEEEALNLNLNTHLLSGQQPAPQNQQQHQNAYPQYQQAPQGIPGNMQHSPPPPPQGQHPPANADYAAAYPGHNKPRSRNSHRQQQQSLHATLVEVFQIIVLGCYRLIYMIFCCCSTAAIEEQPLHRSFCYGAIDGMLTGSGIVATFCGMGLLAPTSTQPIRSFVVAFSACTCLADALCMALGHVWTTHVLATGHAKERIKSAEIIESNRSNAKATLVDQLLERGMLKIDAMSLADTLEGYPDLFISALVGDALIAGGVNNNFAGRRNSASFDSASDLAAARRRSLGGTPNNNKNDGSFSRMWGGHPCPGGVGVGADDDIPDISPSSGSFHFWKFPSYSDRLHAMDEEMDPESAMVASAMTESRREGLFMLMGFSLFAVVPSLIYLVVPMIIYVVDPTHGHHNSSKSAAASLWASSISSNSGGTHVVENDSSVSVGVASESFMSATSIVFTLIALIMWCLGVWKSRFLDSNWMVFGIETVVVLLFCIAAAYGLGALLVACIPALDVTLLETATVTQTQDG